MTRYGEDIETVETRIHRACLVARYHDDVTVLDYIRTTKGGGR